MGGSVAGAAVVCGGWVAGALVVGGAVIGARVVGAGVAGASSSSTSHILFEFSSRQQDEPATIYGGVHVISEPTISVFPPVSPLVDRQPEAKIARIRITTTSLVLTTYSTSNILSFDFLLQHLNKFLPCDEANRTDPSFIGMCM